MLPAASGVPPRTKRNAYIGPNRLERCAMVTGEDRKSETGCNSLDNSLLVRDGNNGT